MTHHQFARMCQMDRLGWQSVPPDEDAEIAFGGPATMFKGQRLVIVDNDGTVVTLDGTFLAPAIDDPLVEPTDDARLA